jgi:hypothetical protein
MVKLRILCLVKTSKLYTISIKEVDSSKLVGGNSSFKNINLNFGKNFIRKEKKSLKNLQHEFR